MRRIGFTGTKQGMNHAQKRALAHLLADMDQAVFHHGDCVGADEEADSIARAYRKRIAIHPPDDDKARAWCWRQGDWMYPAKPYLVRNHEMVDMVDVLIAAPYQDTEILRSGTWATIRYARAKGVSIIILRREEPVLRVLG